MDGLTLGNIVRELQDRRLADLSPEEVEALAIVEEEVFHRWDNTNFRTRALAVLSKLTKAGR